MIYTYLQIQLYLPSNDLYLCSNDLYLYSNTAIPLFKSSNTLRMSTFTVSLCMEINLTKVLIIHTYRQIVCGYVVFFPTFKLFITRSNYLNLGTNDL